MSSASTEPENAGREQLIEAHLPLVRAVARRYSGRGETLDDLVQVGSIGLIKASDRFDPARGVAFATFATHLVEGEIRRHLRDRTSAVRIPRELQRMSGALRQKGGELEARLGRSPTVRELASAIAADEEDVERALDAERARGSSAASPDVGAELADEAEPLAGSEDRLLLARGVRVLDKRERRIVFLRFHADMTEREIARTIGISQAHVSRLLDGALAKLREELANMGPVDITPAPVISPQSAAKLPVNAGNSRARTGDRRTLKSPPWASSRRTPRSRATWSSRTTSRCGASTRESNRGGAPGSRSSRDAKRAARPRTRR